MKSVEVWQRPLCSQAFKDSANDFSTGALGEIQTMVESKLESQRLVRGQSASFASFDLPLTDLDASEERRGF